MTPVVVSYLPVAFADRVHKPYQNLPVGKRMLVWVMKLLPAHLAIRVMYRTHG